MVTFPRAGARGGSRRTGECPELGEGCGLHGGWRPDGKCAKCAGLEHGEFPGRVSTKTPL